MRTPFGLQWRLTASLGLAYPKDEGTSLTSVFWSHESHYCPLQTGIHNIGNYLPDTLFCFRQEYGCHDSRYNGYN